MDLNLSMGKIFCDQPIKLLKKIKLQHAVGFIPLYAMYLILLLCIHIL